MNSTDTLLIEKVAIGSFKQTINNNPDRKLSISDFECYLLGNIFIVIMIDGSRFSILVNNITLIDHTSGGLTEIFSNPDLLEQRLKFIKYTPYKDADLEIVLPLIPSLNRFIFFAGMTMLGQDITFTAYSEWLLAGIQYTNNAAITINIPFAASGLQRLDGFAATSTGTFVRFPGDESVDNPVKPFIPLTFLEVTFVLVTDGAVGAPPDPNSPIFLGYFPDKLSFDGGTPRPTPGMLAWIVDNTLKQNILCQCLTFNTWQYLDLAPYAKKFTWNLGDLTTFTVPFAVKVKNVFVNDTICYVEDLEWEQLNDTVVIANSKLFEDGTRILITN